MFQLITRNTIGVAVLLSGLLANELSVASDSPPSETHVLRIAARDGTLRWRDVLRELTRETGVKIDRVLPGRGEIDLDSRATRLTLAGLNFALRGDITLRADRANECLVVTIDRRAMRDKRDRYAEKIRRRSQKDEGKPSGLDLDPIDNETTRLVLLTHGFGASPKTLTPLRHLIRDDGMPTASFGYHSRHGVVDAAQQLTALLEQLQREYPAMKVTIVAHSMGGIVSRWALESGEGSPTNVDQLIMVAPPNHGSDITRPGLNGPTIRWDPVSISPRRVGELAGGIAEDINRSIRDLRPGSDVLQQLNRHPRNPDVRYSILLGDRGLVDPVLISLTQQWLQKREQRPLAFQTLDQLTSFQRQMDELIDGRGDGVVALRSGVLSGVHDIVVLNMRHNDIGHRDAESFDQLAQAVVSRLK